MFCHDSYYLRCVSERDSSSAHALAVLFKQNNLDVAVGIIIIAIVRLIMGMMYHKMRNVGYIYAY